MCNALNGFERLILDFSAREYFALFDASKPLFDNNDLHNIVVYRAASLLQHCQHLTLVFGTT
jgi:hypothetical protein